MASGGGSASSWEYMDFELEVRESGQGKYSVCVLRSPAGEPQEKMHFPLEEQHLKEKLAELEKVIYCSSETRSVETSRRIYASEDKQIVQDFGQDLFEALFPGEVRACYRISMDRAKQQKKGLRLKLHIEPPKLAYLPWEFLYDPGRDEYLCLSPRRPLVRYLNLPQPVEQLVVEPPLKILGMVASPLDLDLLDIKREKQRMEEAIQDLRVNGLVELTWLEGETSDDLEQAMWGGPWHIFHFIGHGRFNQVSKEGFIALANEEGRAHFLSAKNLATLLDHYDLRLVFLNSCLGARGNEGDAFSSSAAALVRRGIPAVLAMQYEITDEAAIEFSRTFYRAMAKGLPVDAAVARGRTSLSNRLSDTLEWGTPVLHMRSPDGRIFDVSTEASAVTEVVQKTKDREEEQALRRYREAVEAAWADWELHKQEAEWLRVLASNKLGLSASTAMEIERKVMGETVEAILKRQKRAASASVQVPDLIGQKLSNVYSILAKANLLLGDRNETASATVPEDEIINQHPPAGTEVEAGSSVNITVSSGPRKAAVSGVGLERQDQGKGRRVLGAVTGAAAVVNGVAAIVLALWPWALLLSMIQVDLTTSLLYNVLNSVIAIGALGAYVGLHVRQAPSYGRLGTTAFLVVFGTVLVQWLMILPYPPAVPGQVWGKFFDPASAPTLFAVTAVLSRTGIVLLGVATVRAGELPRWFGVTLIISGVIELATVLARFLLDLYSGWFEVLLMTTQTIIAALVWVVLGYLLWSQRGISAGQTTDIPNKSMILIAGVLVGVLALVELASVAASADTNVVFEDDFSVGGWWPSGRSEAGDIIDYENDRYRMYLTSISGARPALLGVPTFGPLLNIEDARVVVDAARTGTAPNNKSSSWGIICRAQDVANYYVMQIDEDGNSSIAKYTDNNFNELASERFSKAILRGSSNRIQGDCVGNKLTLYVNGQKLIEANDSEFGSGLVGLYVNNAEDGSSGVDVLFDNFWVYKP